MNFQPGEQIELVYPTRTHVREIDVCPRVTRRLVVRHVRDLVADPLTIAEFLQRPYTARSRYLVRAWDLDRCDYRQFYAGSSDNHRAPGTLRIAVYLPGESRPHRILTDGFESTVRDRQSLMRSLQKITDELSRRRFIRDEQIRVVADDLRWVG